MKKTGSYKILLADDSPTIQRLVKDVLMPENFEIKTVNDGEQAVHELIYFLPDIVLADTEMPKLNGYQLCEKIKKSAETKHIPVVLMAGAFDLLDEKHAKSIGADGFIVKPFESNELIRKVKGLVEGSSEELSSPNISPKTSEEISIRAEEIKWDEDVPIADEKQNNQMPDEEFESNSMANYVIAEEIKGLINKDDVLKCIYSAARDSIGQIIAENAPNIVENISNELRNDLTQSLKVEIGVSIKSIISDAAEKIIKKEIERIISETV